MTHSTVSSPRAWYGASIGDFLEAKPDAVLGQLAANGEFALTPTQRDAWITEIEILRVSLRNLSGTILLEYTIPRLGRRIDAVLLLESVVFVVEFKIGEETFDRAAIDQVWDYALDLKNFHEGSHAALIIPILVATESDSTPTIEFLPDHDLVYRPVRTNTAGLRPALESALKNFGHQQPVGDGWARAPYHPTPTIVEAARSLYAQHSVEAIARFDAGAQNLQVTSQRVDELVSAAQRMGQKIICFVTGVPGAGKTLVGLNLATQRREVDAPTHAVFLSGNGPLVAVLREALTRDDFARRKKRGEKVRKGTVGESVKAFIQNVHHFRDDALIETGPPIEHVVIFDEAQRAWNLKQTASFMSRKKKRPGFAHSEPEFLISYMDRHTDWAAIVCRV